MGKFLRVLADDLDIDIEMVAGELCDWTFSNADYKAQFQIWLDNANSPKGQAENIARTQSEEAKRVLGLSS